VIVGSFMAISLLSQPFNNGFEVVMDVSGWPVPRVKSLTDAPA
jgi:hypothetical protein